MKKFTFCASSFAMIGEDTSNPYLTVTFRLFSTKQNRNAGVVTEEFIDDIIANAEKYVCLPLYADVPKLEQGDFQTLGHNYNPNTGEFDTVEIGSFFSFEKLNDEYGASLMGTARIPKRNATVCEAVMCLYAQHRLCVSFEIETPDVSYTEDGIYVIDRSDGNKLIGMTVVSVPAYDEAVALKMVAETQVVETQVSETQVAETQDDTQDDKEDPQENEDEKEDREEEDLRDDEELDGENKMTLEEAMARIAELEAQVNTDAQDMATKSAELETSQNTIAEKDTEIANLQNRVAELTPYKEKIEAAEAEAARIAHEQKLAELKEYASAHGLNVEDETVAQAITDMNYEYLINETMKAEAAAKEAEEAKKAEEAAKEDDGCKKAEAENDDEGMIALFASMTVTDTNGLYDRV